MECGIYPNRNRVIGSIIVCASQDIGMLIVGRIINGLAVGVGAQLSFNDQQTNPIRYVQLKFQSTSPSSPHRVNVADSSAPSNGPLHGVL